MQRSSEDSSNLPQSASSRPQATTSPKDTTVEDWEFFQHQKKHTTGLGSAAIQHYKPHELLSNPPKPQDVTLELLMASQSHLGHATSLWNPMNAKYIFGVRGDHDPIHIISLDVTAAHLRRACKVVEGVASRGGLILFVGTREGQARAVVKAAEMAGGCHLFDKWTPGTLTNGQQILRRTKKKVVDELDREQPGFEPQLKYSAAVKPDLVVCLNPLENYVLLHECGIHNIPTVGIIDNRPGAANVISAEASFTIDIRHPDDAVRADAIKALDDELHAIADRRLVRVALRRTYDAAAATCAPSLIAGLEAAVARAGVCPYRLPSGAGHDGLAVQALCPIGMLFVRCKGGISHNPAESITRDDVAVAEARGLTRMIIRRGNFPHGFIELSRRVATRPLR